MLLSAAAALLLSSAAVQAQESDSSGSPGAPADTGEKAVGTTSWTMRLGFYDRSDDGQGNPFLDESLTVIEPILLFDQQVTEDFGYWTQLTYDYVSSASIERLSKFPDQSGASGDYYIGADLGVRYRLDELRLLTAHLGISQEYDYSSLNVGAGLTFASPDRSSRLRTSIDAFYDSIDVIRFDGTEHGTEDRFSVAATAAWYKVLSPRWHGEAGVTLAHQSGFLETAYNAVVVEDDSLPPNENLANMARGFELTEELPGERLRLSLYGRARRWMGAGNALEIGGRVYQDDWGITAFHVEPRWITDLGKDWMLQLRYRYYNQTEADAYSASFTDAPVERTQDSELAAFDSHLFGGRIFWFTGESRWDLGIDYLMRSDGLDHVFASIGWNWSF